MIARTLYPKVVVYQKAITEPDKWIETIEQSNHWAKWYDVGEQLNLSVNKKDAKIWDHIPNLEELKHWLSTTDNKEHLYEVNIERIYQLLFSTVEDYLKRYPLEFQNLVTTGADILRYKPKEDNEITVEAGGSALFALPYHTDRDPRREHEQGAKPLLTITMYLNGDYEGGDINYAIFNGKYEDFTTNEGKLTSITDPEVEIPTFGYKPEAGDIIIFPSAAPFYHSVNKVTKGKKYVIRCHFNQYEYKNSN